MMNIILKATALESAAIAMYQSYLHAAPLSDRIAWTMLLPHQRARWRVKAREMIVEQMQQNEETADA